MRKFTMPYDMLEEIDLRLYNTIIRYGGKPVFVGNVKPREGGKFGLTLWTDQRNSQEIVYNPDDPELDLSPFEPRYCSVKGGIYWIYRIAKRMYQQGGNDRNTHAKAVGEYQGFGMGGWNLLEAYSNSAINGKLTKAVYDELLQGFVNYGRPSAILNIYTALGVRKEGVYVEYKGAEVGMVKMDIDGEFYVDTDNESLSFNPWCVDKLHQAGIRVGA